MPRQSVRHCDQGLVEASKINPAENQPEEEEEDSTLLQLLAEGAMQQTEVREKEKETNVPSVGVWLEGESAEDQPSVEETLLEEEQKSVMRPTIVKWKKGKRSLVDMMQSSGEQKGDPTLSAFQPFQALQSDAAIQVAHDAAMVMEKALAVEKERADQAEKDANFFQGLIERA